MKKSVKFATALAGAAVVVAGGTAFTASNTGMPLTRVYGYGQTNVTGITVATEVIGILASDQSKVEKVTFTESVFADDTPIDRETGPYTATLTTNVGDTEQDYSCTIDFTDDVNTYVCLTRTGEGTGPSPYVYMPTKDLDSIGFTVVETGV